ncbi:hypothetical protein QJQ45_026335 [Haematococcus lacustris]|nr:hypothetical protein QJQ45_026335 [Haematococcus lacustris]
MALSASTRTVTRTAGSRPALGLRPLGRCALRVSAMAEKKAQVIQPVNNDPFIGFLETPVTSAPIVANYLSSLPAYRTGVAPVVRGVEIGLAHGFFLVGPFIKFGPLRNIPGTAEIVGCLSGAGLVLILTLCLSLYGASMFQSSPPLGVKTLSGRSVPRDPLQTSQGWSEFTAGWAVGGLSGVAWAYICTQVCPLTCEVHCTSTRAEWHGAALLQLGTWRGATQVQGWQQVAEAALRAGCSVM